MWWPFKKKKRKFAFSYSGVLHEKGRVIVKGGLWVGHAESFEEAKCKAIDFAKNQKDWEGVLLNDCVGMEV